MDNTLVYANAFFAVGTILLVLFCIAFIIVIVYLLKVLRDFRAIARMALSGAEQIAADLNSARGGVVNWASRVIRARKKKGSSKK